MFLSAVTFAKSKSKTILVKMLSQAGTGYSFNTKRSRLREKLTLLHYDPIDRFLSGKETSHVKSIADTVLETKKRVSSERKGLFSWDHLKWQAVRRECSGTVDCLAFCPPPEYPAGQNDDVRLGACPIAQVKTKVLFVEQKKIRSL